MKNYKINFYPLVAYAIILICLSSCGSTNKERTIQSTPSKTSQFNKIPTSPGYHRVQPGENLYRISLKYGTTVAHLSRINNLTNPEQIEVGQLIKVPYKNIKTSNTHSSMNSSEVTKKPEANLKTISNMHFIWPIKGSIVTNFNGSTSKGIDIRAPLASPVKAAQNGKVIYNDYINGYGKLILISHNPSNTILTAYGHNQEVLVKLNQQVQKGQIIGKVGTNDANEPILHFEIRSNGVAINPIPYLNY